MLLRTVPVEVGPGSGVAVVGGGSGLGEADMVPVGWIAGPAETVRTSPPMSAPMIVAMAVMTAPMMIAMPSHLLQNPPLAGDVLLIGLLPFVMTSWQLAGSWRRDAAV